MLTPDVKKRLIADLMDIIKRDNLSQITINTYRDLEHPRYFESDHLQRGYEIWVLTEETISIETFTRKADFHYALRTTLNRVVW